MFEMLICESPLPNGHSHAALLFCRSFCRLEVILAGVQGAMQPYRQLLTTHATAWVGRKSASAWRLRGSKCSSRRRRPTRGHQLTRACQSTSSLSALRPRRRRTSSFRRVCADQGSPCHRSLATRNPTRPGERRQVRAAHMCSDASASK